MTKRTFQVPGEARVSFTTLPPQVDLAAAFPVRLFVTRSHARAVWLAQPGRYALLIVDERTERNRRGLLLVLAFELDSASLSVFADVSGKLIAATVQEEARRLAAEREDTIVYPPYPRPWPPCPPRPPRRRPRPEPEPDEPVYEILPVPPIVPVPKAPRGNYEVLPFGAGLPSGAEDQ